ncbi:MAG TPA: hypothetical protein DCY03_07130 [Planctomycetaceae bacterium]|nr:hypothetical protein [Planctomycetaceae bacterium]
MISCYESLKKQGFVESRYGSLNLNEKHRKNSFKMVLRAQNGLVGSGPDRIIYEFFVDRKEKTNPVQSPGVLPGSPGGQMRFRSPALLRFWLGSD